jgi:hypothetical protein
VLIQREHYAPNEVGGDVINVPGTNFFEDYFAARVRETIPDYCQLLSGVAHYAELSIATVSDRE